jgi:hypothetical protein
MPKRQSTKRPRDVNQAAFAAKQRVIALTEGEDATEERSAKVVPMRRRKNPAAVALGRLGGLKRAKTVKDAIPEARRQEIASVAARARWAKVRGDG